MFYFRSNSGMSEAMKILYEILEKYVIDANVEINVTYRIEPAQSFHKPTDLLRGVIY